MLYTSLVGDHNQKAADRLALAYNFAGYPCTFFDGGDSVHNGAPLDTMVYRDIISACGSRSVPSIDLIAALDWQGDGQLEVRVRVTNGVPVNTAPALPDHPAGDSVLLRDEPYEFTTGSADADGDRLFYQWDWGDDSAPVWLGPFTAEEVCTGEHTWTTDGFFDIRVRVKDEFNTVTDWSDAITVEVIPTCCVVPGDINGSSSGPDISDLVYLVTYMFSGGPPPPCMATADVNGSGWGPDISDLVHLTSYMFSGGPAPAPCQ